MKKRIIFWLFFSFFIITPIYATAISDIPSQITVGIYDNYPFAYKSNDGTYNGIYVELMSYIAQKEGWNINWIFDSWEKLMERLNTGNLDIMSIIAYSDSRADKYDYNNESVYVDWGILYTRQGITIANIYELENLTIGILPGDIYYEGDTGLKFLLESFNVKCNIVNFTSYPEILKALDNGTLDVGLLDETFAILVESDYSVTRTNIVFQPTELFFAFPKSHSYNSELISAIDFHLNELKSDKNSLYYQIISRYLAPKISPSFPLWVEILLISLGGVVIIFGIASYSLNKIVKKRTRDLLYEKEQFKKVLDNSHEGIITTDVTGIIQMTNPTSIQILQTSKRKIENISINNVLKLYDLKNPEKKIILQDIQEKNSLFRKFPQQCYLQTFISKKVLISLWVGAISESSENPENPDRWIYIFHDISTEKEIEKEMIKAERLNSIGLLTGGIAHDLNNYLTPILANVSYLIEFADMSDENKDILKEIMNASQKTKNLTRQLLDLTKGKLPVKKPANLEDLIEKTVKFHLRGTNIRFELISSENLEFADIDTDQIEQVFSNLTVNAIDAMEGHGILTVVLDNIHSGMGPEFLNSSLNYIRIKFSDTGCGIPSEILTRIFDPFFTTKKHGTGLGLIICQSIIQKHGGHILVESVLDLGTTFTIYLPAAVSSDLETYPSLKPLNSNNHKWKTYSLRVLVLDDEPSVREVYNKLFSKLGIKADLVDDGELFEKKFLESIKINNPYDFLVLDLTVPKGKGGIQTMKRIREIDPDIPAIVASGFLQNNPDYLKNRNLFNGFLEKPFYLKDLKDILQKLGFT
ncbi:MAG: transporter substrate-binding domain-containing protein [Candidatus Lokiarchaeota archaeon]|nr:transporter substrate-binding domain-containing protein [Candidatus Harpocratesius repetitus]